MSVEAADPNKATIDLFTEHLKKTRENSASKNTSKVTPVTRVEDVFSTNRRAFEYKPSEETTIAKTCSTPASKKSSLLWEGHFSYESQASSVQRVSPRHLKPCQSRKFHSNISEGPSCPNSLQGHAEVGFKTGFPKVGTFMCPDSISASYKDKDNLEAAKDSFDQFPPMPPLPDLPPPERVQPFPSQGVENGADAKPNTLPKAMSRVPIGYHSLSTKKWAEIWQQRSIFVEDNLDEPMSLHVQTKVTETSKETPIMECVGKDSSSSVCIASIPDYPPPVVPDNPPPLLPDELEGGEAFENVISEIPSSGTETPSRQSIPALKTKKILNQEPATPTLSGLISSSPTKKTTHLKSSHLVFPHFPLLPPDSLSTVSPVVRSLPKVCAETKAVSADNSTNVSTADRFTHAHITPNICNESKASPQHLPVIENDLMKYISVPSFDATNSSFPALHLKPISSTESIDNPNFGKQINSNPAQLALRSMMDQHHHKVKVIQEALPISPDLKFTRVAKKTWKKPKYLGEDVLSLSASTGNVVQDTGPSSPQCFGSSDSTLQHEIQSSLQLQKLSPQLQKLSPLVETSVSTFTAGSGLEDKPRVFSTSSDGDNETQTDTPQELLPEVKSLADTACVSKKHKLKVTRHLKHGRRDYFHGKARRFSQSPFSSSVLDSNLLEVSQQMMACLCIM